MQEEVELVFKYERSFFIVHVAQDMGGGDNEDAVTTGMTETLQAALCLLVIPEHN